MTRREFLDTIALSTVACFAGRPLLGGLLELLRRAIAYIEQQRRIALIEAQLRYQTVHAMEAAARSLMTHYYAPPQMLAYYDPACVEKIVLHDACDVDEPPVHKLRALARSLSLPKAPSAAPPTGT